MDLDQVSKELKEGQKTPKICFPTLGLSQGRSCLGETKIISAITLSGATQCSRKEYSPEAQFKDLNLVPFPSPKTSQFTTSLSFISFTCHGGNETFPLGCFRSFPYFYHLCKKQQHILPQPTPPSVSCLSLPCFCPQKTGLYWLHPSPGSVIILFPIGFSQWQEIGRKEKEAGLFPCTHTAPSLPYCCSRVAAFLSATGLATIWLQWHLCPSYILSLKLIMISHWVVLHQLWFLNPVHTSVNGSFTIVFPGLSHLNGSTFLEISLIIAKGAQSDCWTYGRTGNSIMEQWRVIVSHEPFPWTLLSILHVWHLNFTVPAWVNMMTT